MATINSIKCYINKTLFDLIQKYPDAKIYTFVHHDVVCADYGYWRCNICTAYYGKIYEYNERVYFSKEDLYDENSFYTNDYLDKRTEIKQGIIIKIGV